MRSADQLRPGDLVAIDRGFFGDRKLARRYMADYPGAVVTGIARGPRCVKVRFRYLDTDVHDSAEASPDAKVAVA